MVFESNWEFEKLNKKRVEWIDHLVEEIDVEMELFVRGKEIDVVF